MAEMADMINRMTAGLGSLESLLDGLRTNTEEDLRTMRASLASGQVQMTTAMNNASDNSLGGASIESWKSGPAPFEGC